MLIITRGLPGCGKSTWAKRCAMENEASGTQTVRVNRDSLRSMLHFDLWSKENEKLTVKARNTLIATLLSQKINVICDDTNLDPFVLEELTNIGRSQGHAVIVKDFTDVPLHVCIDRDSFREGKARVGPKVILDMHARYLDKPGSAG